MGAAASVQQIYRESMLWYKKYFDEEMYQADFQTIDKDSDGAITYKELQLWIKKKAGVEKGAWAMLLNNEEVLQIAHDRSAKYNPLTADKANPNSRVPARKVVDVHDFRALLIHLFAISTLWVHFKNADEWVQSLDFGNCQLSLEEFKLACRTITGSYCNEQIADDQIAADFAALDKNHDGALEFIEVCDYCCQFLEPAGYRKLICTPPLYEDRHSKKNSQQKMIDFLADVPGVDMVETAEESEESEKHEMLTPARRFNNELQAINSLQSAHKFRSLEEKNKVAMEAIAVNMDKNQKMADFMEVKFNTENEVMNHLGQLAPIS